MGPLDATVAVLSNYAVFSGRASRAEYWWFAAVWFALYVAILTLQRNKTKLPEVAFYAATIVPCLSVSFRRLQDIGHSGWWSLVDIAVLCSVAFLAIFLSPGTEMVDGSDIEPGTAYLTVFAILLVVTSGVAWHFALPSEPGPNKYGPNPHEVTQ